MTVAIQQPGKNRNYESNQRSWGCIKAFSMHAKLGSANCDRDSGPCGILAFLVKSLGLSNLPLDEDSNTVISLVV